MSGLFSECYSEQDTESTQNCTQNGCGLGSVASLAPFADELKKGILSASQLVLKQLRKKQQRGAGARRRKPVKNKKQQGRGQKRQTKRGNKKQTGFGKQRKQQGKGVKKQCRRYPAK